MIVDELVAVLGYDLRGEGNLNKFNRGIKGAERNLAAFAAAAARYGRIAGAALGAGAVFLGKSIIQTNAEFQSFHATLEVLEGSSEKADKSFAWIREFGKTTPYEVGEVTEAFVRLRSYGIDPMNGTLLALGDASSAMNKPLMSAVEMLADAATGEFERMKEFGVRAKTQGDEVTFLWTENGKDITKTVKKTGTEITKFLTGNFARFRGAMDKQSAIWKGLLSNVKDGWTDFQILIGEAGFFKFAEDNLRGFYDWIKARTADGSMKRWAENISAAFIAVANAVGFVAGRIMKDGKALIDFFSKIDPTVFYAIAAAFGLLMIYLFPVTWALAAIVVALDDILEWWSNGKSRFGDFIAWIKEMTGASQGLATALAAVAASLMLIAGIKVFSLLRGIGNLFKGIAGGAAGELAGGVGGRSGGLLGGIISSGVAAAIAGGALYGGSLAVLDAQKSDATRAGEEAGYMVGRPGAGGAAKYSSGPTTRGGRRHLEAPLPPSLMNDNLDTPSSQNPNAISAMLANMNANLARLSAGAQPGATITDARQDNRSFPVSVAANTTINVTQAAAAGAAAVGAVSAAVGQAAAAQATRINAGPATP